jgi:hypothetical protein
MPPLCPAGGISLTFIAFLTDSGAITQVLAHIGEPTSGIVGMKRRLGLHGNVVVLPASVPPAGLVPMATVTLWVAVVTVFPDASWTTTTTAGLTLTPAVTLAGGTEKASLLAPFASGEGPVESLPPQGDAIATRAIAMETEPSGHTGRAASTGTS